MFSKLYIQIRSIYNKMLRPHLPLTTGKYNGVIVKDKAIFDLTRTYPNFEDANISRLQNAIRCGDHVIIIGGGRGVSAVKSVEAGAGRVTVFEGALEHVELVRDTLARNDVDDLVTVKHAIVGKQVDIWGDTDGSDVVYPEDIPECDVLELDCEGSEVNIIKDLGPRPHSIIIECHPAKGATADSVAISLPDEYEVIFNKIDDYDGLPLIHARLV